jgi:hypothetical protein
MSKDEDYSEREQREYRRRARRRQWFENFRERQRTAREWIALGEIADWCASAVTGADVAADERARTLAYQRLDQSAREGDLEVLCRGQRQSRILYLHPRHARHGANRRWLSREQLRHVQSMRDLGAYCWLPRELAHQWLAAHGYPCSAQFDPAAEQPVPPRETKLEAVRCYIVRTYPRGIPAGVTDNEIARQTGASERTVRRARHSPPTC